MSVLALAALAITFVVRGAGAAPPTAPAAARSPAGPLGRTTVTLDSVGSNGQSGTLPSAAAAMAGDGGYVAFQTRSALAASSSVPQPPPPGVGPGPGPDPWRVYVRASQGSQTTLLSDAAAGDATAPAISGNGKLIAYEFAVNGAENIDVASQQATGGGPFGGPGNLSVQQVTGTRRDLPYERIPACPVPAGAARFVPCGPRLSADGTTLVYPAEQSPVSPALTVSVFSEGAGPALSGNILDFTPFFADGSNGYGFFPGEGFYYEDIQYQSTGTSLVRFHRHFAAITGPFSFAGGSCGTSLKPGAACFEEVQFNTSSCNETPPASGQSIGYVRTGTLTTLGTTPAAQSRLTLVAFCYYSPYSTDAPVRRPPAAASSPPPAAARAAGACSALPAGVPLRHVKPTAQDNELAPLANLGGVDLGRAEVVWTRVRLTSNEAGFPTFFDFSASSPAIQLVNPCSHAVRHQPKPCAANEPIGGPGEPTACTAYFLVRPSSIGTDTAAAGFPPNPSSFSSFPAGNPDMFYLAVSGITNLVVARHDPTGAGHFATSPTVVVSVDGHGHPIPGASQPSVSATGRYVAFTAPVPAGQRGQQPGPGQTQVWVHDTDKAGNRSYHPGTTVLASCLPGAGRCRRPPSADSPSLSGNGQSVAFATTAAGGATAKMQRPGRRPSADQVYVRNLATGRTTVISAGPGAAAAGGNDASFAPVLSADGSTAAYVSTATNLTPTRAPAGLPRIYIRQLLPGFPGNAPGAVAGPAGSAGTGTPAMNSDGGLTAFETSDQLVKQAPAGVTSVYTLTRFPGLVTTPIVADFGGGPRGPTPVRLTVTVHNAGPGPVAISGVTLTGPFSAPAQNCRGAVVHAGGSCQLSLTFVPGTRHVGTVVTGTLVVSGGTGDAGVTLTVPAIARVTGLTLSPATDVPGQVVTVTGAGFPAHTAIRLSWKPGLGTASAVTNAAGRFTASMLIFPEDVTGTRMLLATSGGLPEGSAAYLVSQPSQEPPFTRSSAP